MFKALFDLTKVGQVVNVLVERTEAGLNVSVIPGQDNEDLSPVILKGTAEAIEQNFLSLIKDYEPEAEAAVVKATEEPKTEAKTVAKKVATKKAEPAVNLFAVPVTEVPAKAETAPVVLEEPETTQEVSTNDEEEW